MQIATWIRLNIFVSKSSRPETPHHLRMGNNEIFSENIVNVAEK